MPLDVLIPLVFITLFLVLYFSAGKQGQLWLCLIGSYLFISYWDWRFSAILAGSTLVDYILSRMMANASRHWKKNLLALSVLFNLAVLALFKYLNLFFSTTNYALKGLGVTTELPSTNLILPLGISFYTFQKIGYMVDVYRGKVEFERSFLRFSTFIAFFPKILAGPIVSAGHFLPQLKIKRSIDPDRMLDGLELMVWGIFKKFVIANSLGMVVDQYFSNPSSQTSLALIIAVLFYTFQIYCDFSGYSDMAIGFGRVLGFDLGINFHYPYFATSIRDFWTRWHISLSNWIRDYLYIPLGGNRHGAGRTYSNLLLAMMLCGLWHGANWTFMIWGGLHGMFLVLQRIMTNLKNRIYDNRLLPVPISKLVNAVFVFLLVSFAWIFFRAPALADAFQIINGIMHLDNLSFSALPHRFFVTKGLILIVFLAVIEALIVSGIGSRLFRDSKVRFARNAILIWAIPLLGSFSDQTFIYTQF